MLISHIEADSKAFAMSDSPKASFGSIDSDHAHNMAVQQQQQQQLTIAASATQNAAVKRKRNLPGTPDPDAEIIALSPKTLMASNRFVCEVCNKGFQREQNLQLHRRGHNLPWKLRQRTTKEIRRRVYLCPEPTCVHHDPSRALGDLTGIKKHFCRKHGEKKWKCDKCAKKYAVQSDWKAHSKTCGTREYRCDCGTLFSRRDSFITHRAFCDALAEESARIPGGITVGGHVYNSNNILGLGQAGSPMSIMAAQNPANSFRPPPASLNQGGVSNSSVLFSQAARSMQGILGSSEYDDNSQGIIQKSLSGLMLPAMTSSNNSASLYSNFFTASGSSSVCQLPAMQNSASSALQESEGISGAADFTPHANSPATSMLTGNNNMINTHDGGISMPNVSTLYSQQQQHGHSMTTTAQMSATALLQKAAQMGSTTNNSSMLRGFAGMATADINSMTSVGMGISNSWQLGSPAQDQQHRGSGMIINSTAGNNMAPNLVRSHSFNTKGSMDHITRGSAANSLVNVARSFSGNSRSWENEGLQDLMNSLAGGGSSHAMQFGTLNNNNSMQSAHAFGGNIGDSTGNAFGGFRVIAESLRPNDSNIGISDHHHNQQPMQGGLSNLSMLPAGMINHPRSHDQDSPCGDRLTRDFLGVGVASGNNMVNLRTQHAACNNHITSLDSDSNSASYNNNIQRDQNLR